VLWRFDAVSGLHAFIMASNLKKEGTKLNLVFALGYVLVFKPTRFDLAGNKGGIHLDLEHQNGDVLLLITF